MGNENYVFRLTTYDVQQLLPQVSKALEKRTELISRERYAKLWKGIDKLDGANEGQAQSSQHSKMRSIVFLAVGIFLFVPGMMKPQELLAALIVGAIAICAGIYGLWSGRKNKKNPFDKSAELLLKGKDVPFEEIVEVSFSEEGMVISTEHDDTECIPYHSFECAIETRDILLMVYDTRVTVLKKVDLVEKNFEEFREFVSKKIEKYQVLA